MYAKSVGVLIEFEPMDHSHRGYGIPQVTLHHKKAIVTCGYKASALPGTTLEVINVVVVVKSLLDTMQTFASVCVSPKYSVGVIYEVAAIVGTGRRKLA